jgi:hypothetical protein
MKIDKKTQEQITISLTMYKFIKDVVREFNLNTEQEERLHQIAIEDTLKLYDNDGTIINS